MTTDADWAAIGRAGFVSLGTYRRSGELVSTPVWIAPDGGELVVTTEAAVGKVKRLRNDARVVLQPCSRFGAVEAGALRVETVGAIAGPPRDHAGATTALRRKYGAQYPVILGLERLVRRLQRKPGDRLIIRITRSTDAGS